MIRGEVGPGTFLRLFEQLAAEASRKSRQGLVASALLLEREAKQELTKAGTHKYGTRTPATPGGPPALISGTLRRAVTHTPAVPDLFGWQCKVGVAAGVFPPYGKSKTSASQYGLILEVTGLANGATFPWLHPAYIRVLPRIITLQREVYMGGW